MIAEQIAKDLLSIEAVSLSPDEPFTWASGLKSPIYCDNRVTMSYPEVRLPEQQRLGFLMLLG
jgi:orotate phosphoribosyltransferase